MVNSRIEDMLFEQRKQRQAQTQGPKMPVITEEDLSTNEQPIDKYVTENTKAPVMPSVSESNPTIPVSSDVSMELPLTEKSHTSFVPKDISQTSRVSRSKKVRTSSGQFSVVRDVPKSMMQQIMREFPSATKQTDALVAYVCCHSPGSFTDKIRADLSPVQLDLIANWDGDIFAGIQSSVEQLVSQNERMQKLLRVIEVVLGYNTFDRLGFRLENPAAITDVDLNEDGLIELLMRLEAQSFSIQREKDMITGR